METIRIQFKLKNGISITIKKFSCQGFYGGYIWAEGYGLSDQLLHVKEDRIYLQNTRLGKEGKLIEISSLKSLLEEILVKDTMESGNIDWSEDIPWTYIEVSDNSNIENMAQLIERIESISNISEIEASQEFEDDDDESYSTSMSETIDFNEYRGSL